MSSLDRITVQGLRLWAHVGVLEEERALGQWFELEATLLADLGAAARGDDLGASLDYSRLITALQHLARTTVCRTLEHYSERMLDLVEALYGPVPIQLELRKCAAPVAGFSGRVSVTRQRHWPAALAGGRP
ncbi:MULTISPECIES: dihydroneopterin aldolase [Aphanothece]|uniref:dihydroneopterin aldolase n=1 Tax=Aphanothece TaxID=1121 RepID=UPI0039848627